ncbi:MAG: hypothetical protein Q4G47_01310 [Lachnospiraceae bacterium]|nr:hypothetical protein [Lachnospiraceae bacterium]
MKKKLSLSLLLLFTISILSISVQAASKETVYVITSVKYDGNSAESKEAYTQTIAYNNTGLIKTITTPSSEKITESFYYNPSGLLTKYVRKIGAGREKGTVKCWYEYKKQKLVEKTEKGPGYEAEYEYNWKNGVIASADVEFSETDESGEDGEDNEYVYKYTYKNGNVVKIKENNSIVFNRTVDKNGNVTKQTLTVDGAQIKTSYYYATIRYDKNQRVSSMTVKARVPMMTAGEKYVKTFTYKKMSVDKEYAPYIKAQQSQLINASIRGNDAEFAW